MKGKRKDDFVEFVCEQLAPLGVARARAMFGGHGIYVDDWFCAIIANDTLWFKVDDESRAEFEALGSKPFKPFDDQDMVMSYYDVPADILDNRRSVEIWGRKAIEAAMRAKKTPRKQTSSSKARSDQGMSKPTSTTNPRNKRSKRKPQ